MALTPGAAGFPVTRVKREGIFEDAQHEVYNNSSIHTDDL